MRPTYPTILLLLAATLPRTAAANTIIVSKAGTTTTIQAGVNQANPGDTVLVEAGVYRENVIISANRVGLQLIANGNVTVDARGDGGVGKGVGIVAAAKDVVVRGFIVENALESVQAAANGHGFLASADGVTIESCAAFGCATSGFRAFTKSGIRFKDCKAYASTHGFLVDHCQDLVLDHCEVNGSSSTGAEFADCSFVTIKKSSFLGNDRDAIECVDGSNAQFVVKQCTFENCDETAILFIGASIEIKSCTISNSAFGVFARGSDIVVRDTKFEQLRAQGSAIEVDVVVGATLANNVIDDVTGTAVRVANSSSVEIVGNTITHSSCSGEPVVLIESDATSVVVDANVITDCAGTGIEDRSDGGSITENHVSRCIGDGIAMTSTASLTLVDQNTVDRCGGEGLDQRGANVVVTHNSFKKCHIDLTNSGSGTFSNNKFKTGGTTTAPDSN